MESTVIVWSVFTIGILSEFVVKLFKGAELNRKTKINKTADLTK